MSAIEASSVNVRTMADGTLRISFDIKPRFARDAFALFGAPGTPAALAALRVEPEPVKPKGGELSKWLAMRCTELEFQLWASMRWSAMALAVKATCSGDTTAELIRRVIGVDSRAEIDNDTEARARFEAYVRKPWEEHNKAKA